MFILAAILGILALYALTIGIVLLFAKIEKEPDGTPILDTDSWHFKLAYPINRHDEKFLERFSSLKKISICAYFIKLFVALWIEWPIILVISAIGTIVTSMISISFGLVTIMDWRIWWEGREIVDLFRSKKVWLPTIGSHRVWPVWLVAPAIYIWLLCLNSKLMLQWTFTVLGAVLCIVVLIALCILCVWFSKTDQKKASLTRGWLMAKKNKWCPLMKVKVR